MELLKSLFLLFDKLKWLTPAIQVNVYSAVRLKWGEPTVSFSVMAAEHRVCDQKHEEQKRQSDGDDKPFL